MNDNSTITPRGQLVWKIPMLAIPVIALAVSAEAAVNSLRAYGLGQQLEHFTMDVTLFGYTAEKLSIAGVVLVFGAIAISLAQATSAWVAFKPGAMARQRSLAVPATALLLAVSVTALSLTILEAQRRKAGGEGGQRTVYDIAKGALKDAQDEFDRIKDARTTAEIKSAMEAAPVSRLIFRRTAECTDVTQDKSFDACKPILDLRQEMAKAIRKVELAQKLPGLTTTLEGLPRPAEPTWFEQLASSMWGWLVGLSVVGLATFGSVIFARPVWVETPDRPAMDTAGQSDYPALADHPELLANSPDSPKRPDRPNGGLRTVPKSPRLRPDSPAKAPDGRTDGTLDGTKSRVLSYITARTKLGLELPPQGEIARMFDVPKTTMSGWCIDWEASGLIPKRVTVGRCKMIAPASPAPDNRRKASA